MNAKLRKQLARRKRKLLNRISVSDGVWQSPMIRPSNTKIELGEKQQADVPAREVIRGGNDRCDQENTISQLKASGAFSAPVDTLESNWAYMAFASLAWTLKLWSGMLVGVKGNPGQRRVRRATRMKIIRMEFATFLNSLMLIPAQVIQTARQRTFRLLTYRPSVDLLMTLHDHVRVPLRC